MWSRRKTEGRGREGRYLGGRKGGRVVGGKKFLRPIIVAIILTIITTIPWHSLFRCNSKSVQSLSRVRKDWLNNNKDMKHLHREGERKFKEKRKGKEGRKEGRETWDITREGLNCPDCWKTMVEMVFPTIAFLLIRKIMRVTMIEMTSSGANLSDGIKWATWNKIWRK